MRRLTILLTALVTLVVGVPGAAQAAPAYPTYVGSVGDSITRGFDATLWGCFLSDCPAHWRSTGTSSSVPSHLRRIRAAQPGVTVTAWNAARTGAKVAELDVQLAALDAAGPVRHGAHRRERRLHVEPHDHDVRRQLPDRVHDRGGRLPPRPLERPPSSSARSRTSTSCGACSGAAARRRAPGGPSASASRCCRRPTPRRSGRPCSPGEKAFNSIMAEVLRGVGGQCKWDQGPPSTTSSSRATSRRSTTSTRRSAVRARWRTSHGERAGGLPERSQTQPRSSRPASTPDGLGVAGPPRRPGARRQPGQTASGAVARARAASSSRSGVPASSRSAAGPRGTSPAATAASAAAASPPAARPARRSARSPACRRRPAPPARRRPRSRRRRRARRRARRGRRRRGAPRPRRRPPSPWCRRPSCRGPPPPCPARRAEHGAVDGAGDQHPEDDPGEHPDVGAQLTRADHRKRA